MNGAPNVEVVPLRWCVDAMYRATERVRGTGWNDPIGAYAFVAETLFWVDIVDKQLRENCQSRYEAALVDQPEDVARMMAGMLFVRNRITHEVDLITYLVATAKEPDCFAANLTWQPLPPRPGEKHDELHCEYEAVIAGRDVVDTLLVVTVFLGEVLNEMWKEYGTGPTT